MQIKSAIQGLSIDACTLCGGLVLAVLGARLMAHFDNNKKPAGRWVRDRSLNKKMVCACIYILLATSGLS